MKQKLSGMTQIMTQIITNNLKNMGLDFVLINSLYASLDNDEVIEILQENDRVNDAFDYKVLSSTVRKDFSGKVFTMGEQEILRNYNFFKSKEQKGSKVSGDIAGTRVVNLSGSVKTNQPKRPVIASSMDDFDEYDDKLNAFKTEEIAVKNVDFGDELSVIKPIKPIEKTRTFEDELVDKLISKHSGIPNEIVLHLTSDYDIDSIIKSMDILDVNIDDVMDNLFNNNDFINSIKSSFKKALTEHDIISNYDVKPTIELTPETSINEPNMDDFYEKVRGLIGQNNEVIVQEIASKLTESEHNIIDEIASLETVFKNVYKTEPNRPLYAPPIEAPIELYNEKKDESKSDIIRDKRPINYDEMINNFVNKNK